MLFHQIVDIERYLLLKKYEVKKKSCYQAYYWLNEGHPIA